MAVLGLRMDGAGAIPPIRTFPVELRIERIRHVILLEIARAPAGHVKKAIVHREVDVGHERRHRPETLQHGGRSSAVAGSAGIVMIFFTAQLFPSRYQVQIEDERSLRLITQLTNP